MPALDWIMEGEWKMGNGQCPDCHGVSPKWVGDFRYKTIETVGHEIDCPRASAILELGGNPKMVGQSDAGG